MKKLRNLLFVFLIANISFAQENSEIRWLNPAGSDYPAIAGQAWPNEVASHYHRLPFKAQQEVRNEVWELSKHSAGLSIRFWTNASSIFIKYEVKGTISFPHMPSTGVSGLDLYGKSYDGEWLRYWGSYTIDSLSNYHFIINDNSDAYNKYGREFQLFLPLYNELNSLEIGVHEESFIDVLPIRKEKPIVAYGTSICQGACASRPGMAWTNILERKLERPMINLGFSGNGRLEPELIDLMAEIDAKLYILDCLPNLDPEYDDTYTLTLNAVKRLKELRPNIPIILTAHIGYADGLTNEESKDKYEKLNNELDKAYQTLLGEGYSKVFLLSRETLGLNFEAYVDHIHPNDHGMLRYANAYENLIREILGETNGTISTTIPKTQSRDIRVYQWENRHQKILELNKVDPPRICLIGNSIVNFWGGEPKTSIQTGLDSWEEILKPMGVRNFGFGWDRIENVLWRVYHDELDGFEAEQIVLMIGTNNLHLNNENEIIKGLEKLVNAIRERQPKSTITMIGILPRRGRVEQVDKMNLLISQMAIRENIEYQNIGQPFLLHEGKIDESLFTDGLHPNAKGYQIMAKALQEILEVEN